MKLRAIVVLLAVSITMNSCVYKQAYKLEPIGETRSVLGGVDSLYWYNIESNKISLRIKLLERTWAITHLLMDISNLGEDQIVLHPSKVLIWDEENLHKGTHFRFNGTPDSSGKSIDLAPGAHANVHFSTILRDTRDKDWADTIFVWMGDFISVDGEYVGKFDTLRFVPTKPNWFE